MLTDLELNKPLAIKLLGALLLLALLALAANDYAASLQPYYFLQGQEARGASSAVESAREGFLPSTASKSGVPFPVLVGGIVAVALMLSAYSLSSNGAKHVAAKTIAAKHSKNSSKAFRKAKKLTKK